MPFNRRKFLKLAGEGAAGIALFKRTNFPSSLRSNHQAEEPSGSFDPWLEIDLNHMAWNISQLRKFTGGKPIMAVIKGNAYGHGLVGVGSFLEKQEVAGLMVGKYSEALKLREAGVKCPILNIGPFSQQEAEEIVRLGISQSVYSDRVEYLIAAARRQGKRARIHLKIDSGLGRVGVPYYRALPLVEKVASTKELLVEGVFTTFSEDEDFDLVQLQRFLQLCQEAENKGIGVGTKHAASSAAVLSLPQAHLDMVRPGIMIYGHYPSAKAQQERKVELKPVLQLKTRVIYVKELRPGDSVSYHREFVAEKKETIATLPIGYSDGYPPQVAGKAEVLIKGSRFPLVSRITANHMTVNLQGRQDIGTEEEVVLIGNQGEQKVTAEEVADWAGISVYKLLCGMSPLLPRVYIGNTQ
ncbi:MAG: alanine racemase, partial [Candidatus Aminicenantes bacterium]|nr:alanine racemase [Candidatus Aminicenantes bacterium]MDH5714498.1 alanine racemase [Candidatus Aminicenantes bacterium]